MLPNQVAPRWLCAVFPPIGAILRRFRGIQGSVAAWDRTTAFSRRRRNLCPRRGLTCSTQPIWPKSVARKRASSKRVSSGLPQAWMMAFNRSKAGRGTFRCRFTTTPVTDLARRRVHHPCLAMVQAKPLVAHNRRHRLKKGPDDPGTSRRNSDRPRIACNWPRTDGPGPRDGSQAYRPACSPRPVKRRRPLGQMRHRGKGPGPQGAGAPSTSPASGSRTAPSANLPRPADSQGTGKARTRDRHGWTGRSAANRTPAQPAHPHAFGRRPGSSYREQSRKRLRDRARAQ